MKNLIKFFLLVLFFFSVLNYTLLTNDCRTQWVQMSDGLSISMANCLAISGNYILAGMGNFINYTTNNGVNWYQSNLGYCTYSFATSGNEGYAGVSNAGVYHSSNNGQNWDTTGLRNKTVYAVAINSQNYIFAGTFGTTPLYISTNNGQSWAATNLSTNAGTVWAITINGNNIYTGTNGLGLCLSINNGANWTEHLFNESVVYSISISGSNIFAGTHDHGIYRSTNNGTNWAITSLNFVSVRSLTTYGNYIFAGTDSGFYVSTNNGVNWTQKNEGLGIIGNKRINSLLIANNYIFAATQTAAVWRRNLSDIIGIQKISENVPEFYSLGQNYPNPFNSMTNFKFQMLNSGMAKIIVYDILGKEVITLVNEKLAPGTYEIRFDGGNLSSGIYFYRMTAGNFVQTKKMLMIK
ncbi:MAG: T9SS type A sorting domain-containing protein [Ignavibacteria bacterium]|nr:T9SS type A sorting domain-containing protein [Ignavibacteria bacterium]